LRIWEQPMTRLKGRGRPELHAIASFHFPLLLNLTPAPTVSMSTGICECEPIRQVASEESEPPTHQQVHVPASINIWETTTVDCCPSFRS
jgi:hypothetical protein